MNGMIINHLMYADDTCTIAPSPTALQELLDICADFAVSNFIIFNKKKTKCICFKPNWLNGLFVPTLCLNDVPLTFVTSNKYLGLIIRDKHQDDADVTRYAKSLYSRGNRRSSPFKTCSFTIKEKWFRSFLCNAHGCHLWSTYKQYTYKHVVMAFNNIYRNLFGILWGRVCLQFMPITILIHLGY